MHNRGYILPTVIILTAVIAGLVEYLARQINIEYYRLANLQQSSDAAE